MAKITKKRGRPAIRPYIERIILLRISDEQKKPLEVRMPPKILAYEIRKEIKEHIRQGDCLPALSTLEKRISAYSGSNDSQDEFWGLLTLTECAISSEALPIVFDLWAYALREYKRPLTIREAKWAAHFYRIIQNDAEGLLIASIQYAAYEKAYSSLGDKFSFIAKEVGFLSDTELYADTLFKKTKEYELTTEELLKIPKDPEILKRKRQSLLSELRNPEILKGLGLEHLIPNRTQPVKKKRRQRK